MDNSNYKGNCNALKITSVPSSIVINGKTYANITNAQDFIKRQFQAVFEEKAVEIFKPINQGENFTDQKLINLFGTSDVDVFWQD